MRIAFAGTPEFARVALTALAQAGHDVALVLTQPDRPKGRGLELIPSPVKLEAMRLGIPVAQPISLRGDRPGAQQTKTLLSELAPDLMVVAAYGLILPADVLGIPRFGCLNIHASLLPRWRGAAPIQRAIAAGDLETGICLMQMEEGLDTGPVWSSVSTEISPEDNFQTLHDRLADLGARELVDLLRGFPPAGKAPKAQPTQGVTYAEKIHKTDLQIDWSRPSDAVAAQIQAFDPAPGAVATIGDLAIKCFQAKALSTGGLKNVASGQIIQANGDGFLVACGHGAVSIGAVQRPGGRRLGFREFLNGRPVTAGQRFHLPKE